LPRLKLKKNTLFELSNYLINIWSCDMNMFLIKCEDNFYCIVDNEVIYDKNVVKDADAVILFWNNKIFSGVIIIRSGKIM